MHYGGCCMDVGARVAALLAFARTVATEPSAGGACRGLAALISPLLPLRPPRPSRARAAWPRRCCALRWSAISMRSSTAARCWRARATGEARGAPRSLPPAALAWHRRSAGSSARCVRLAARLSRRALLHARLTSSATPLAPSGTPRAALPPTCCCRCWWRTPAGATAACATSRRPPGTGWCATCRAGASRATCLPSGRRRRWCCLTRRGAGAPICSCAPTRALWSAWAPPPPRTSCASRRDACASWVRGNSSGCTLRVPAGWGWGVHLRSTAVCRRGRWRGRAHVQLTPCYLPPSFPPARAGQGQSLQAPQLQLPQMQLTPAACLP